jgi:hypothetical protein
MPKKAPERELRCSELTAAIAENFFGWKNVHDHNGELIGKKQDKLGRWRLAKLPDYSSDQTQDLRDRRTYERAWARGSVRQGAFEDH